MFWNVMISNSLSCTREAKKMLCSVPGLCENRLNKKTIPEPLPVGGKHGSNWRIPNSAGGGIRAGVIRANKVINFMRKTRVTQTTNPFTSFENSKTFTSHEIRKGRADNDGFHPL